MTFTVLLRPENFRPALSFPGIGNSAAAWGRGNLSFKCNAHLPGIPPNDDRDENNLARLF